MRYAKYCPSCKSRSITLYAGGMTGAYECKKCGFVGMMPEIATTNQKSAGKASAAAVKKLGKKERR
jgi:hypothetical protein